MGYRGKVGENIVGGVECTPLIRFGFDCFNIAIMPGGGLFTFLFKFHQIGDKKAKEILYYSTDVQLVQNRRPWYPLPPPLLLPLMLLPAGYFQPYHNFIPQPI